VRAAACVRMPLCVRFYPALELSMSIRRLSLTPLLGALAVAGSIFAAPAAAADEVSLYTTREPKLIQPMLDAFTKESGIKVNTVFVKDGLLERVKAEGAQSPAD